MSRIISVNQIYLERTHYFKSPTNYFTYARRGARELYTNRSYGDEEEAQAAHADIPTSLANFD